MVRDLLEDHPAAGAAGTACSRHSDLRGDVERLLRLVDLYAGRDDVQHPTRPDHVQVRLPESVGPHHGRVRARDPADPAGLCRRAALLRPRHRDNRYEIAPLRATFDEAAELYDRARPGYPPELFDDLANLGGLHPGARVLEIGSGTGKATLP